MGSLGPEGSSPAEAGRSHGEADGEETVGRVKNLVSKQSDQRDEVDSALVVDNEGANTANAQDGRQDG